jgi:hypothetical protein
MNGSSLGLGIEMNRAAFRMAMSVDLPIQHPLEPVVSCDTALSCLARLGICKEDDPEIEEFRRRAVLEGNTLPAAHLIELAGKFGFQGECTRLDWNALTQGQSSFPIIVFLKNTNVVVVTGTDNATAEAVSVWDPLHSDEGVLSVPREDFERAWDGEALVVERQPPTGAEASSGSSGERGEEIVEPPPEHGSERGTVAAIQRPQRSAPVPWLAKSRLLAAIGFAAAAGIGVPLWIYAVSDEAGTSRIQAKEVIPEAPRTALSIAEPAPQPMAAAPAASAPAEPIPLTPSSVAMPAPSELPGGPAAAVSLTTEASAPQPAPAIVGSAPAEPTTGPGSAAAPVAAAPSVNVAAASPPAYSLPVEPPPSAAETAALLARGDALLGTGDLAAARLFYERAANAGEAQAALRLGETYDPIFLEHSHLRGVHGSAETAPSWYRRARDLGAAEAEVLLNSLQAK